jgi:hypothetical protein
MVEPRWDSAAIAGCVTAGCVAALGRGLAAGVVGDLGVGRGGNTDGAGREDGGGNPAAEGGGKLEGEANPAVEGGGKLEGEANPAAEGAVGSSKSGRADKPEGGGKGVSCAERPGRTDGGGGVSEAGRGGRNDGGVGVSEADAGRGRIAEGGGGISPSGRDGETAGGGGVNALGRGGNTDGGRGVAGSERSTWTAGSERCAAGRCDGGSTLLTCAGRGTTGTSKKARVELGPGNSKGACTVSFCTLTETDPTAGIAPERTSSSSGSTAASPGLAASAIASARARPRPAAAGAPSMLRQATSRNAMPMACPSVSVSTRMHNSKTS